MPRRVCLKDIAEEAGVSVVTVSLALNGSSRANTQARVSAARRREIQEIAARMGYSASAAGRILKSKTINDIGLLFCEETEQARDHLEFLDLNIQVNRLSRELGIRCQLEWFDPFREPDRVPSIMRDGLIGGLLIAGNPAGASKRFLEEKFSLPYVRIGEPGPHSVMSDIAPALHRVMEHLAATGHRRVALINGPTEVRRFREFEQFFRAETRDFGWHDSDGRIFTIPFLGNFGESSQKAIRYIFGRPDPPDAVLVASGQSKSILFLIAQAGLRIPEDVSVIHFVATDRESLKFAPGIAAIEADAVRLSETAVSMLRELMTQGRTDSPNRVIPARFQLRGSVRGASVSQPESGRPDFRQPAACTPQP